MAPGVAQEWPWSGVGFVAGLDCGMGIVYKADIWSYPTKKWWEKNLPRSLILTHKGVSRGSFHQMRDKSENHAFFNMRRKTRHTSFQ
jgi:hypothetical protein